MEAIKKLYAAYRTVMLIGVALGFSLVFYVITVEILKSYQDPIEDYAKPSYHDLLRLILYGVSLCQFIIIGFVRSMLIKTSSAETISSLIDKLMRATIVTLALCEMPAIFGLVLFFVGRYYADFYLLLGISLVMFFFYFPRYNRWKEWLRKKAGPNWDSDATQ
jgi:hypothetical protein